MTKRKPRPKLPEQITDDPVFFGRFKVDFSEAVARSLDESDWKKFAIRFGLNDEILEHPRFLRSLSWRDPDYEGIVLELVDDLCTANVEAVKHLFDMSDVQDKLDEDIIKAWNGEADPLIAALSHSFEEVQETRGAIDLSACAARVEAALPNDPQQAIGATKDLLEAAMRSILNARGIAKVEKLDFPSLTNTCFIELGLVQGEPPKSKVEGKVRKIAESAKKIVLASNELRNLVGTGHGRVVGMEDELTAEDASFVASNGMILAAWLLRRADAE